VTIAWTRMSIGAVGMAVIVMLTVGTLVFIVFSMSVWARVVDEVVWRSVGC